MAAVERGDPNPIPFTTPCGKKCRVWLGHDFTLGLPNFERALKANRNRRPKVGDDRHWRVNVGELLDQEEKRKKARLSPRAWNPTASALNRPIVVVGRNDPIKDMDDALGVAKGFKNSHRHRGRKGAASIRLRLARRHLSVPRQDGDPAS